MVGAARPKKVGGSDTGAVRDQLLQGAGLSGLGAGAAGGNPNAKAGKAPAGGAAGGQQGLLPLKRVTTNANAAGNAGTVAGGQTAARRAQHAAGGGSGQGATGGAGAGAGGSAAAAVAAEQAAVEAEARDVPAAPAVGTKRGRGETGLGGGGSRKQTKPMGGGAAPVPTDRDGVPTVEGLRSWVAARVQALQEKASAAFGQHCAKAIEAGVNGVNELAQEHHCAVSRMLEASLGALELAQGQHAAALGDIEALRDGLLEDLEAGRAELLNTLRTDVVAAVQSGVAAVQSRNKI